MATQWFADDERAIATAIGSLSLPLGCIIGLVISPFFIHESDQYHHEVGKQNVNYYMFISAIITTVLNIPMILFFQAKPKYFPSASA